jgi:hypothetical protein
MPPRRVKEVISTVVSATSKQLKNSRPVQVLVKPVASKPAFFNFYDKKKQEMIASNPSASRIDIKKQIEKIWASMDNVEKEVIKCYFNHKIIIVIIIII